MKVTKTAYMPGYIRRRRKCLSCGKTWTTREFFDGAWLQENGAVTPNSGGGDAN